MATMLYALETPPVGGDTHVRQPLPGLGDALRRASSACCEPLRGGPLAGKPVALQTREEMHSKRGTAADVRGHQRGPPGRPPPPRDRPKALYVSLAHTTSFEDMTEDESAPLARLPVRPPDPPRAHLPLPLAPGLAGASGTTAAACTTRSTTTTATAA